MAGNRSVCKKFLAAGLCAVLLFSMSACQENPKGSIVVHKDMDNLISKAREDDPSKVAAADIVDEVAENYETYQTTITDKNLGVAVNVYAKLNVPEVDTLSIYRVEQVDFEQELIDKIRKTLMGDKPVYDGTVRHRMPRSQILMHMEESRAAINRLEADRERAWEVWKDDYQTREEFDEAYDDQIQEQQDSIDELQEFYENTPDRYDITEFPQDGLLRSVEELYNLDPQNEEYDRMHTVIPTGDYLNVVSDGADGTFQVLRAQNSEEYGGHVAFRSTPKGYEFTPYTYSETLTDLSGGIGAAAFPVQEGMGADGSPIENLPTQEEAVRMAEDFLEEVGITGFAFARGGWFREEVHVRSLAPDDYFDLDRRCYILQFRRELDGVLVTQATGTKRHSGREADGIYTKHEWLEEGIEFRINENGIVGFDFNAPLNVLETTVANAGLKSFEEVKNTFETMICIVNAAEDQDVFLNISEVDLTYSRIAERDSFTTGLIVPVWSFYGTIRATNGSSNFSIGNGHSRYSGETGPMLLINAIDGSIIDSELGY